DALGKISAHTRMVLRGDSELYMRIIFRRTPRSNWKDLRRVLSIVGGLSCEVTDIKTTDVSDLSKPFEIEFNVSQHDFFDQSSKKFKIELPFPPLRMPATTGRKAADTQQNE